mgnify:CR=1 FL=1
MISEGILTCYGLIAYLYVGINQIISNIKPSWNFDINNYVLSKSNETLIQYRKTYFNIVCLPRMYFVKVVENIRPQRSTVCEYHETSH